MEQKSHSRIFLRKRKFFTMLPVLVLPFITLMFWALGGGSLTKIRGQEIEQGFNMQLPGANLKDDRTLDKLSYYEKATSDSLKLQQLMESDPYYVKQGHPFSQTFIGIDTSVGGTKDGNDNKSTESSVLQYHSESADPNETKVYQKLAQLDASLNKASAPQVKYDNDIYKTKPVNSSSVSGEDIDRLEQMMKMANQKDGADPEMQQLNGMLEKILDIQHPDRVQDKEKQPSGKKMGQVYAVAVDEGNSISLLANKLVTHSPNSSSQASRFYSLEDSAYSREIENSIQAIIHQTQILVNGATVKLRLTNDVSINGIVIPKDNFIFGTAQLKGERLCIIINSIRYRNSLFPVELSVYDMDGMEGIYIPGTITRDAAKQYADRASQQLGFTSLDPSIGIQAASAGVEAAKSLFSKKVQVIKVTVKAGYQVLLKDEKQEGGN
ncbi:MAG: conjugative transposon protein TraM [Ginsengibacter sp.]